jgi:drug/metabolite transporter (DMT)-like permease
MSAPAAGRPQANLRVAGYACIASATLFWGIAATLGRAVFTGRLHLFGGTIAPIPPLMLAQSRTTFAFLLIVPVLLALRGRGAMKMSRRDALDCMVVGVFGIAASNFFYYYAIQQTTVATAIIMQYIAPVLVLLYMIGRKLQKPTTTRLLGVTFAVVGSVLAIGVVTKTLGFPWLTISTHDVKLNFLGVTAALLSAITFSFYNIFGQHLVARHDRWTVMVWAMAGAAIGWLFVNPPWKVIAAHYAPGQWGFMALFSVFSIVVPFSLYLWGLQLLDPTRAIVTSCLEPVFAILIAALALGETVSHIQVAGIVLTLAATIVIQLPEKPGEQPVFVEPIE